MADKKITQLTQHTSVINSDLLPVVDITATETKKLAVGTLRDFINTGLVSSTNTGSFYVSSSVTDDTITFTQGDGTTETIIVDNVNSSSYAETATNSDNVGVVIDNTTGTKYVPFVDVSSGYDNLKVDTGLVYSAFSNTLTVGGAVTAPAFNGLATNATNVNIGTTSLNTNYYVSFAYGAGNNRVNIDGGGQFIYNPSTNTLTVPTVVGNLTGTATNATSASYALTASYAENAGVTVDTGSLLVTASAALNVITFTKGDASTFNVTVDTGSAVTIDTGSLLTTASFSGDQITFTKGDGSTFAGVITSVTSSISASYATTASYVETAQTASYVLNAVSASFATTASYVPSGLPTGGTAGQILVKSSGTDYDTSWSDPANLPFVAYAKDADQDIATAQIVTFPSSSLLSAGSSFGSMASTGVFTFTQTGNYLVTINFNTSEYQTTNYGDLDIWGRLNSSNDPRYLQLATNAVKKGSLSEVIPITSSNTTLDWWSNNSCTVYGTGGTKTRISIVKLN